MAKTVNLPPVGFTGPNAAENAKRADKAVDQLHNAQADYMNKMEEIFDIIGREQFPDLLRSLMGKADAKEYIEELEAHKAKAEAAREEMLRAIAGRPPVPPVPAAAN